MDIKGYYLDNELLFTCSRKNYCFNCEYRLIRSQKTKETIKFDELIKNSFLTEYFIKRTTLFQNSLKVVLYSTLNGPNLLKLSFKWKIYIIVIHIFKIIYVFMVVFFLLSPFRQVHPLPKWLTMMTFARRLFCLKNNYQFMKIELDIQNRV